MNIKIQKLLLSVTLIIIFLVLQFSSLAKVADLRSLDLFRSNHSPHPSIVILAIDNKSLGEVGRWPWSRAIDSQIIDKLQQAKPQLAAIDIMFSESGSNAADAAFAASLKNAGFPVVLASQEIFQNGQTSPSRLLLPLPQLTNSDNVSTGIVNVPESADGLTRLYPKPAAYNGKTYLPFSFQAAKALNAQLPTDIDRYVNFAGSAGTFQTFSISDLLGGKIGQAELQDKIVMIGATASDLHDTLLVPESQQVMAGIEYHANVLDNILLQRSIYVLPALYERVAGLILLLLFLFMLFRLTPKLTAYITVAIILLLPIISFMFWHKGTALSYIQNLLLALSFLLVYGLYSWYSAEREKRRIGDTFKNYFSPSVMEMILKDPASLRLGGKRAEVTVLFSDIRGFTTITENLPPEKLTTMLHEYFTEMTDEILATDGVVDKFIGDAIMAFWGAPIDQADQADRAVKTAANMVKKLKQLQKKWEAEGYPPIDIGIGIHSGVATVGNMGSSKRFDYTVIGDDVNIASRLEGLNKEYKTNIIVSEATKKMLKQEFKLKSLGDVLVKGKTKPVKIYTIKFN
jgi:adenylate cyclase